MPPSLRDELQQGLPFSLAQEEGYLAVLRTADVLRRQTAAFLRTRDLTLAQYNVLRILRGAGPAGHLTGEVGARLVVLEPDVPRLLDRIEKKGWISRAREADDRRCVRVRLTGSGRRLVDGLDAPMMALHRAQFAALDARQLEELVQTLEQVRNPGPTVVRRKR